MKPKIINIIPQSPAYDLYKENRPPINWNTSNGNWVGIWGYSWSDVLGNEVLKNTDEIDYEVWQPDLRADKIYSHRFENGLIHRAFPSFSRKKFHGIKFLNLLESPEIISGIHREKEKCKIVLHINSDPTILLNSRIISTFGDLPIVNSFHGVFLSPKKESFKLRKNIFTTINYLSNYRNLKKHLNNLDFITYQNNKHLEYLDSIDYQGQKEKITMGCDFDFWVPGNKNKEVTKKNLGIIPGTKVFLMASRFNSLKQIDKVINAFTQIVKNNSYNFSLLIAGHGVKEYEDYLKEISSELLKKGKLKFVGYLKNERMLRLYQASDFFITSSTMEGCSVSVIKALACEVPIISTKVGGTYELMKQYGAGKFIETRNYSRWETALKKILSGERIKILEREIAKDFFHWPNIAAKFINIYRRLVESH